MGTTIRVLVYVLFIAAIYCVEHEVPVILYYRRAQFLVRWRFAAWAQRKALISYRDYMEEAEYTRG